MKITKQRLKEIIKEEIQNSGLLSEKRGFFARLFGKRSDEADTILDRMAFHTTGALDPDRWGRDISQYEEWEEEYLKLRNALQQSDPNDAQREAGRKMNDVYITFSKLKDQAQQARFNREQKRAIEVAKERAARELEDFRKEMAKKKPAAEKPEFENPSSSFDDDSWDLSRH